MGRIRVVIADDSSLARGLLRSFLESDEEIEVVGEASNGRQAVDMAHALKPDLITMDLEMPVMSGLQAIEEIEHLARDARMVFHQQDAQPPRHASSAMRAYSQKLPGVPRTSR